MAIRKFECGHVQVISGSSLQGSVRSPYILKPRVVRARMGIRMVIVARSVHIFSSHLGSLLLRSIFTSYSLQEYCYTYNFYKIYIFLALFIIFLQGINYVAALLLLIVKEEEKCFWLLHIIVTDILPPYYNSAMSGSRAEMEVLCELITWVFYIFLC